jgi:hypothetical protein
VWVQKVESGRVQEVALGQVLKIIPVSEVITNGQMTTTNIYEHFLDAIANAKAQYTDLKTVLRCCWSGKLTAV